MIVTIIMCDAPMPTGLCPTQTLPWPDVAMARLAAERDGWRVQPDGGARCPYHAGRRP